MDFFDLSFEESLDEQLVKKNLLFPFAAAKMEKAGLIIRVPNEMNRRASDIVLTRQGRSVSEKLIEQRRGRYREMMACLSEDEKVSLYSMLNRMKEDWQQRFRAVPESTIALGASSLQKERNKISETSSDGK